MPLISCQRLLCRVCSVCICRHTRELTEKGLPPPPEPDFATLIPNVPHWMIVRIKRGSHILTQLIGEATRQHRVMSVMGVRPAVSDVGSAGVGSTEAGLDSSERAAERCTAMDSCVNSVIEGFLV